MDESIVFWRGKFGIGANVQDFIFYAEIPIREESTSALLEFFLSFQICDSKVTLSTISVTS
jgi:hypothetical protein